MATPIKSISPASKPTDVLDKDKDKLEKNKLDKDKDKEKKSSQAFDKTIKIIHLVFMFFIVCLLFLMFLSFLFGFSVFGGNSNSGTSYYTEKILTDYSSKHVDELDPFFPSGIPQDGCYLAYICPGVPSTPENCTNCTEYGGYCATNSSCYSNCCKYGECRFENECKSCIQENHTCTNSTDCCEGLNCLDGTCKKPCESYLGDCSNNSDCCSNCCRTNGECGFENECTNCVEEAHTCVNSSQCCYGLECLDGTCKEPCKNYLGDCTENSDCCSDCCRTNGECGFENECKACGEENQTCSVNSDCCSGKCYNGVCKPTSCLDLNVTCSPTNNLCCSGCCNYYYPQFSFVCLPENLCQTYCGDYGTYCKMNSDCCSNVCLGNSTCGCIQYGYSCPGTGSCCPGYECKSGMCVI